MIKEKKWKIETTQNCAAMDSQAIRISQSAEITAQIERLSDVKRTMLSHSNITCCSLFTQFRRIECHKKEREKNVYVRAMTIRYYAITGISAVTELIWLRTFPASHHMIEPHKGLSLFVMCEFQHHIFFLFYIFKSIAQFISLLFDFCVARVSNSKQKKTYQPVKTTFLIDAIMTKVWT